MNCAKFLSGLTCNVKHRTSICRLVPRRYPWSRSPNFNPRGPPSIRWYAPLLADGGCPGCWWRWLDWWRHHVTHPAPGVGRGVLYDELPTPRSRSVGFFQMCIIYIYHLWYAQIEVGWRWGWVSISLCLSLFLWYLVQKFELTCFI